MRVSGQTPEELETLLEDAFVLQDAQAVARLFDDRSVLVTGPGPTQVRGREEISRVAPSQWEGKRRYLAEPRLVFQAHDTTLLIGDGVINVARRGSDGAWRYVIAVLQVGPTV